MFLNFLETANLKPLSRFINNTLKRRQQIIFTTIRDLKIKHYRNQNFTCYHYRYVWQYTCKKSKKYYKIVMMMVFWAPEIIENYFWLSKYLIIWLHDACILKINLFLKQTKKLWSWIYILCNNSILYKDELMCFSFYPKRLCAFLKVTKSYSMENFGLEPRPPSDFCCCHLFLATWLSKKVP